MCPYGQIRPKPIPYFSLHVRILASGLDWSHSAINKYSVQPRQRCCYNWFLPAADFRPDPPPLGRAGGSADKKFSSCFLNSYIIQTHFRMKPEEPPPAPVARQGGGGQPDRSNMFPILSVPLTRNWEWIHSPSPSPFPSSSSIATSSSG